MTSSRRTRPSLASDLLELLSSMRFAIGLLTILAIASVIGTVLRQNEPWPNYVAEFGPFWFEVYRALGLFDVYHSAWFLVILIFLVLSTGLCIWRNTPGFLREMRGWREQASSNSLAAMSHTAEIGHAVDADAAESYLRAQGFAVRRKEREDGLMLAAKKGSANKLGYFFAHIALVVICIGGLIDGNVPLKVAEFFGSVTPETRDLPQSQVPDASRLGAGNLSFRGSVTLPEGRSADVVFLNSGNGYFVQDLPFYVTLKQFHIDYYSNGMPKRFASDVVVTDKQSGKETSATIEVNHPLIVDGIAIYQSSFGDGGSGLSFKAWDLRRPQTGPATLPARSMASQPITVEGQQYMLEFNELRTFNVESTGTGNDTAKTMESRLTSATSVRHDKQVRNIGPSISYRLRNAQGQANEYLSYLAPQQLEGRSFFVTGVRTEVGAPFSYLRYPLDADGSLATYMRLKNAFQTPQWFAAIGAEAARRAQSGDNGINSATAGKFADSVTWVLERFSEGGFAGLESFLQQNVPEDARQAVADTYLKILQSSVIELMNRAQAQAGLPPLEMNETNYQLLLDGLVAYSGSLDYGSPVLLQFDGFDEVKASGLQMTRSPGKTVVYIGSVLLVIGILFMFYVRELRVWVLIGPTGRTRLSMSSNRKNSDLDRDFNRYRDDISQR